MRTVPEDTMPGFEAGLVGGRAWRLAEEHPSKLALLAFYRGVHCPICRRWLGELERLVPRFTEHGVSVIALSCDTRERAERAKREWRLDELRVGYGVNPDDGTLYAAWVQSSTHARPHFPEVLSAVESMLAKDLPRPAGGA